MSQFDAVWKFNMKTDAAKAAVHSTIFKEVRDIFELDIKPKAQQDTPVEHGTNRRSIDTEVGATPLGLKAALYSQSGYGGYLEVGTRYMKARPYLWPAFNKYLIKLNAALKSGIGAITPAMLRLRGRIPTFVPPIEGGE